jgi:hypothetical protein
LTDFGKFYDRSGVPISMQEWGRLRWSEDGDDWERNLDNVRVAHDALVVGDDPVEVSTVWLGIDHGFGHSELPVIFETMVFGGKDNQYCQRYCTEEEAKAGHTQVVVALIAGLRLTEDDLCDGT